MASARITSDVQDRLKSARLPLISSFSRVFVACVSISVFHPPLQPAHCPFCAQTPTTNPCLKDIHTASTPSHNNSSNNNTIMGVPTHRTTRTVSLSVLLVSLLGLLAFFIVPATETFSDTYNPLTYNRDRASPKDTADKYASILKPVSPLFGDEKLKKRLESITDSKGTVFTFFNDDKIRRLSINEQHFHRRLLRKWALLYHSLGFNVHILHYNDALENPKMKQMADRRVLFGKNDIINENYLKMLAWSSRLSTIKHDNGALYTDYTIFPSSSRVLTVGKESERVNQFQLIPDYEFQVMLSDRKSLDDLLEALILKNRDFNIVEGPGYGDIFADYSIGTWKKLLNTNNLKTIVDMVPTLLNKHIRLWRLAKYDKLNIVDAMVLGDHYFTRPALQGIKALLKCEDSAYPPPTRKFIDTFEKEILPRLPDRTTVDSDKETVETAEKQLKDLMTKHIYKCPTSTWKVSITNDMVFEHRTLNFVAIPHPLSAASVMKHEDKKMVTSTDLVTLPERNLITTHLAQKLKNIQRLHYHAVHKTNSIFFPSELLTVDTFAHTMSIFFGFDIPAINDQWGVEYDDQATSFTELSGHTFAISEGEIKWKLDSAKTLVANYESPHPYVINQRQSDTRLKQYREDLKLIKKPVPLENPKVVLQTQNFESRHDPIVEIAESWNKDDADLWWDAKMIRAIDEDTFRLLADVEGVQS